MKVLILTDCQMDFITGPLSVKKRGKETIEKIKIFINRNKDEIGKVIFKLELNNSNDKRFKRNGGDMPPFCVKWTPGSCIEPTLLKLLIRLNIPYEVCLQWKHVSNIISNGDDLILAGMNGNTTFKDAINIFWNIFPCTIYWPGVFFINHNEELFKYLRSKTEGIFEVPKRQKTDLYVNLSRKQLR